MAGHGPTSNLSALPVSVGSGPREPVPVQVDTPIWLSTEAATGSIIVGPGVCPGPEVWGVPLGPLSYEFLGRMVPCRPWVGTGEAGTWFQSPSEDTFLWPSIVLRCIPRLALPEDASAVKKEMEQLAKELRHRRMTLGYSQADVGFTMGVLFGKVLSQTTICRFEAQQLSLTNMCKLRPLLKMWLEEVDTKNLLGLWRMKMILQQFRKERQANRERRIGNSLEKLFLQRPKPTPQQISYIAEQPRMQKDLVQFWFYNRSTMGSLPANDFFPVARVGVSKLPFPGPAEPVCFPLAPGLHFSSPTFAGPCIAPLYSSAPFPEARTLYSAPSSALGLPRLYN